MTSTEVAIEVVPVAGALGVEIRDPSTPDDVASAPKSQGAAVVRMTRDGCLASASAGSLHAFWMKTTSQRTRILVLRPTRAPGPVVLEAGTCPSEPKRD
jgi:hypothetical protein